MMQATDRNMAIDVLRGAAALAVVVMHARELIWVGLSSWLEAQALDWLHPDTLLGFVSLPFRWGAWGVPLFFVISGYCIHRPEVRKRKANPDYSLALGNYAARRAWRILPTLAAALVLTAALDHVTRALVPSDNRLGDDSLECFAANLASLQNIVAPTYGSNIPLWTLSIEIHFYLVYPLFFWATKKFGVLASMAGVFIVSAGSWLLLKSTYTAGVVFLPYWFSWVVGAYVAEAELGAVRFPSRWLIALSVPCVLGAMTIERWQSVVGDPLPVVFSLLAIPFALLVWYAVSYPMARVWSNRVSRSAAVVGLFSYSLYATHFPVLVAYRAIFEGGNRSAAFSSMLPALVVAIAVAYICYLLVEQWTLRLPARRKVLS